MRTITKWIIGVTIVVLILWDVAAYLMGVNATISVILTDIAGYTPILPFLFGMLMGHWFWPARGSKDP